MLESLKNGLSAALWLIGFGVGIFTAGLVFFFIMDVIFGACILSRKK